MFQTPQKAPYIFFYTSRFKDKRIGLRTNDHDWFISDAVHVLCPQVEKSLQRIQSGQCNPMYTSQQSVENKVRVLSFVLKSTAGAKERPNTLLSVTCPALRCDEG